VLSSFSPDRSSCSYHTNPQSEREHRRQLTFGRAARVGRSKIVSINNSASSENQFDGR
jgi:hypothetical protein